MKIRNSLIGILLLFVASNVFASKPVVANVQSSAGLKLVGQAQMRWFMFPLYRVSLKTADGRYQENQYPQMLDILYLRTIDKQDLLTATDNQWIRLGVPQAKRKLWISQLGKLWPTIKKGDRLAFQVNPDGYNYFIYNGKRIGGVADKQFGKSFLDIWLSPKTSQPGIRQRLIG
jgi:hypothetical protein